MNAVLTVHQPPVPTSRMTKFAFWSRFTPAEIAAYMAALPADVNLQAMDRALTFVSCVDRDDPRTAGHLQYLSANPSNAPVLTAARADEILNTPVSPSEAYIGP